MLVTLEIVTVVLAGIALVPALAHALELPGKMRLGRDDYLAVQPIYYPGFTFAGFAEPLAVVAALALAVTTFATVESWLAGAALLALLFMQAIFWFMTQPANKFWLRETQLSGAGKRFFGTGSGDASGARDWSVMRDRWELSHVLRAIAASIAFVLLVTAVAL